MISDLLELKSVSRFRHSAEPGALRSISLTVKAQETVCLFGAPGSGIHRIAPLIFGLLPPTSGTIRWMGIEGLDPDRRRLIRYLPASDPCAPVFQVSEYLQWVSLLHRVPYSRVRAHALIRQLNLGRRKNWLLRRLPPDEVTCLRWGAHLAGNPLIIVAENPSASAGKGAQEILLTWFNELLNNGGGLFFINDQITHLTLEEKLDPVCYFMYGGRIVLEGALRDLRAPFRMVTFEVEDLTFSDLRDLPTWSIREVDMRLVIQTDLHSRESIRKAVSEAQGRIVIEEVSEKPLYQWLGF